MAGRGLLNQGRSAAEPVAAGRYSSGTSRPAISAMVAATRAFSAVIESPY